MGITAEEAQAAGLSQAEIDAINEVDTAEESENETAENETEEENDDASDESGDSDDEEADDNGEDEADGDSEEEGSKDVREPDTGDDQADTAGSDDLFAGIEPEPVAFVPKLTGELLPEFAQAVEKVYDATDSELESLEAKHNDGELDAQAYKVAVRQAERERDAEIRRLNAASTNAEIAAQQWQAEQAAFFKANQAYNQPLLFNALNAEVIRIAELQESAGKSGLQVLMAAKASVDRQLAAVTGKVPDKEPAKQKQAVNKPKVKRPDVQTLGGVPAAAAADTGMDKFAHIDKLSGLAYEQALSKMSEAEQAAYLASR